jgi:hypothetical protein
MKNQTVVPANYDPYAASEPTPEREEIYVSSGFVKRRALFLRLSDSRSTPARRVYVLRFFGSKGRRIGPKYVVRIKLVTSPAQR